MIQAALRQCPVCGLAQQSATIAGCSQCKSDLYIHRLLKNLEVSMQTEHSSLTPSSSANKWWVFTAIAFCCLLLPAMGIVYQLSNLNRSVTALTEIVRTQPGSKNNAGTQNDLIVSLANTLAKAIDLYAEERAEFKAAASKANAADPQKDIVVSGANGTDTLK